MKMEYKNQTPRVAIAVKGLAIWLIMIVAEIGHAIIRDLFLMPLVGEFRSNQIGVFTSSIIILVIAIVFLK